MARLSTRNTERAMTLIEVLVVIACIAIVASLLLPPRHGPRKDPLGRCFNNLRQIDLVLLMYAEDNNGKFPIQVSITNGGTMEYLERNQTFPHYQKLSPYLRYTGLLVCPADKNRSMATNSDQLTDTNLSYFLNADVSTNRPSVSIMAGDRSLAVDGLPVHHGTLTLTRKQDLSWTRELHPNLGGLGFADGHVETSRTANLNSIFQHQGLPTVRLSVP